LLAQTNPSLTIVISKNYQLKPFFKYTFFLLGFLTLMLSSCKTARNAKAVSLKNKSSKFILKKMADQRFEADWLSAKLKITYADEYETRKLTANIRMRKDSIIWMNVKKMNVEAARIKITPDSIYAINRLNKEYFVKDLSFLEKAYNLPSRQIGPSNFSVLQEVIFGNPIFFDGSSLKTSTKSPEYQLNNENDDFKSQYLVNGISFLLTQMAFEEKHSRQNLKVSFERSKEIEEYPNFSYFRNFDLYSENFGNISLNVKFLKLEINSPKSIRFEIPSHYTKVD
jgi:hypothetical protein